MAEVCSIIRGQEFDINFVASVTIPMGFMIIGNGTDPDYPYTTYLSLDKDSVQNIVEEELREALITIPNLNPIVGEGQQETVTMPCLSRVRAVKLRGPLFYNSVVSGFIAKDPLNPTPVASATGDIGVVITEPTAFSDSKPIQINTTIAYACFECNLPDDLFDGFDVEIAQQQEFVIDERGSKILYNKQSPEAFIGALKGEYTQTIHIPYTLTIRPKVVVAP